MYESDEKIWFETCLFPDTLESYIYAFYFMNSKAAIILKNTNLLTISKLILNDM